MIYTIYTAHEYIFVYVCVYIYWVGMFSLISICESVFQVKNNFCHRIWQEWNFGISEFVSWTIIVNGLLIELFNKTSLSRTKIKTYLLLYPFRINELKYFINISISDTYFFGWFSLDHLWQYEPSIVLLSNLMLFFWNDYHRHI